MQRKLGIVVFCLWAAVGLWAQPKRMTTPWLGAGPTPCVGRDGGVLPCPAPRVPIPAGAVVIDLSGATVLPSGLTAADGQR